MWEIVNKPNMRPILTMSSLFSSNKLCLLNPILILRILQVPLVHKSVRLGKLKNFTTKSERKLLRQASVEIF